MGIKGLKDRLDDTTFKSLKYGHDRPGGGDSGQPYEKVDINTVDRGFNRFRMTKFDDGLVRGGVVGAANASVIDTLRIGKFLTDFPKGPLFIVKQVGLQLSNPKLETKKFPSGPGVLGFLGGLANTIQDKLGIGPTRLYNLGINTLAQVPLNAFGGHLNRHGLLPIQDDNTKYLAVAQYNNEEDGSPHNRLIKLKNRFRLGDRQEDIQPGFKDRKARKVLSNLFGKKIGFLEANEELTIDRYIGGPGSVYGIGNTTILRNVFTEDSIKINKSRNKNFNAQHLPEVKINNSFDFGISLRTDSILAKDNFNLIKDQNISGSFLNYNQITNNKETVLLDNSNKRSLSYTDANKTISNFIEASAKSSSIFGKEDFNNGFSLYSNSKNDPNTLNDKTINTYSGSVTWLPSTGPKTVNKTGSLGLSKLTTGDKEDINKNDFTTKGENTIRYTPESTNNNVVKYAELRAKVDKVTSIVQDTYTTNGVDFEKFATTKVNISRNDPYLFYNGYELANKFKRTNDTDVNDDTLALQFRPLNPFTGNPFTTLKFLGYITDYSENYDSNWNSVKYVGRAENFYIFNEFKRTVDVGFNIPCFNRQELRDKHCALSELASALAGKYDENGLLGGIITVLKLGQYIDGQPGIINNLRFSPIEGSSWDLDEGLAFYIKVSFGFTVIHNYLPQYSKCGFIYKQDEEIPNYIDEDPYHPPEEDPVKTRKLIFKGDPIATKDTSRVAAVEKGGSIEQRAQFDKNKVLPQTKQLTDAKRKLLANSSIASTP
jgi:hypothetical protein